MLTADNARNLIPDYVVKLYDYIDNAEERIIKAARRGRRCCTLENLPQGYDSDVAKHLRDNGFSVDHYLSPAKLVITW